MKKLVLFSVLTLVALITFGQNYAVKVGTMIPLPVTLQQNYRADVGSSLATLSHAACKKMDVTFTSGFMRFQGFNGQADFTNVPLLAGMRYNVSKKVYFGADAGIALFNKEADVDNRLLYTPYLGCHLGQFTVDMRYFNWYDYDNKYNNIGLCISYKL